LVDTLIPEFLFCGLSNSLFKAWHGQGLSIVNIGYIFGFIYLLAGGVIDIGGEFFTAPIGANGAPFTGAGVEENLCRATRSAGS